MNKKLVIWGASGHSLVVADIVRLRGEHELVGLLDDMHPERHGTLVKGLPVLGGKEQLESLRRNGVGCLIFGFGNCSARLELAALALEYGFVLETALHPSAVIASDAMIGPGTVIAAGAIINPGVTIGSNVIINTRASIDHECNISDGVHICPGVTLGGSVTVGRGAWVGIGTTVKDHISVGADAMIGAGSVVVSDVPERVLIYGVPARIKRSIGER